MSTVVCRSYQMVIVAIDEDVISLVSVTTEGYNHGKRFKDIIKEQL
jgi:hypothetical protein